MKTSSSSFVVHNNSRSEILNRDLLRLLLLFFLAWLLVVSGRARASGQEYSVIAPAGRDVCHVAAYPGFSYRPAVSR